MKTFKLVELKVERKDQENRIENLPLADGLIINKEDGENSWLIEALLSKQFRPYFEHHLQNNDELKLLATITKKNNRPAHIIAKIRSITMLKDHISVLFDGRIYNNRTSKQEAEMVLRELISKGLSGQELLEAFSKTIHKIHDPKAKSRFKKN